MRHNPSVGITHRQHCTHLFAAIVTQEMIVCHVLVMLSCLTVTDMTPLLCTSSKKHLVNFLIAQFTAVQRIIYFSDGCAGLYKNFKNFLNLCHYEQLGLWNKCRVALFCNFTWEGGM